MQMKNQPARGQKPEKKEKKFTGPCVQCSNKQRRLRIFFSLCLSLFLFLFLSLSLSLFVSLSLSLSLCLSLSLTLSLSFSFSLSLSLSLCLFLSVSFSLSLCLSLCLFLCLSPSLSLARMFGDLRTERLSVSATSLTNKVGCAPCHHPRDPPPRVRAGSRAQWQAFTVTFTP